MNEQVAPQVNLDNDIAPEIAELEKLQQENMRLKEEEQQSKEEVLQSHIFMFEYLQHITIEIEQMKSSNHTNYEAALRQLQGIIDRPEIAAEMKNFFEQNSISEILLNSDINPALLRSTVTRLEEKSGNLVYRAQFPTNNALQSIGLGDILEPKFKFVQVWKKDATEPIWGRQAKTEFPPGTNRIGYVDSQNKYIPIVDGDMFLPIESLALSSSSHTDQNETVTTYSDIAPPAEFLALDEAAFPTADQAQELRMEYANSSLVYELLGDVLSGLYSGQYDSIDAFERDYQERTGKLSPIKVREQVEIVLEYLPKDADPIEKLTDADFPILKLRRALGGWEDLEEIFVALKIIDWEPKESIIEKIDTAIDTLERENPSNELLTVFKKDQLAAVLKTLAEQESNFKPFDLSGTGCMGIFQFTLGNTNGLQLPNRLNQGFNPFHTESSIAAILQLWKENYYVFQQYSFTTEELQDNLIMAHYAGATRVAKRDNLDGANRENDQYNQKPPRVYLHEVKKQVQKYTK